MTTRPDAGAGPAGPARPQEIIERALAAAKSDGCVVIVSEHSSVNLRWASNTLTTNGVMRSRSLTVIATATGDGGTAAEVVTRSNVAPDDIEGVVRVAEEAAQEAAQHGEAAQDARPLVTNDAYSPTWEDPPALTSTGVFASFAPALGVSFERARADGRELFGFAEHDLVTTYLGSSTGVRLRHDQPTGKVEITGKSDNRTRSTWVGQGTRDFSDVDALGLDDEITKQLGWASRSIDVSAGRHDAILPPGALADLMVYLYWSSSAREAHDGQTVFSRAGGGTRVGDQLSGSPVNLWSDPAHQGLTCEPFVVAAASGPASSVFDNGLPMHRTDWVREGTLAALLQTRASAELTGLAVTPGVDNLLMDVAGSTGSLDDLVAATSERTLLLTCLWYIREVDPQTLLLTGLTRDGVYVVEGGEVIGAATNFRFNESPVALLDRIDGASETRPCLAREFGDYFTRTSMPALRVKGFNMSTVSRAS